YRALMDSVLLDRHISVTEADALVNCAQALGIDQPTAQRLHEEHLQALVRVATVDGAISTEAYADLCRVGMLLDMSIERVDTLIATTNTSQDNGADAVVGRFSLRE